ncbi:YiiX/YebB-like N1pC/P60 family cysteine hydrolase [Bacteriovorax sp. Seq25_V]|uniref:YiiX/YebB-like N1pC/P60 family cysteine hydrolase n=1 Tax=Bacteriovorax sp. Seq25_V TaxID=1201288 RepID=UPI00038A2B46|nr:YiiX/YebB-like N1pC/P60 family cysteine hydrolase [Bacteriovorax sp. Seq25_V]EQC48022.1 orthopoxovirus protein, PF05708 family [Bacteriovorax sp. Seq25_V]
MFLLKFLRNITLSIIVFGCLNIVARDYQDLQVGDVLLLDLDCYSCQRIEDETFGPYSHSGIVVEVNGELVIAQALSTVHHLRVSAFLKFSPKKALHLRPKKMTNSKQKNLSHNYMNKFYGAEFDHDFLWDNDSFYCSEFLFKLLDSVNVLSDLKALPMNFERNYDFWNIYFDHGVPQGEIGISPNDFYRSSDFEILN